MESSGASSAFTIAEAARGYLGGSPGAWLRFARILGARAANEIASLYESEDLDFKPDTLARSLADLFLSALLSPETVRLVESCENRRDQHARLVEAIREAIQPIEIEAPDEGDDYWGEVVDVSASGQLVRRWEDWDWDYWEAPAILSVHTSVRPYVKRGDLKRIVERACSDYDGKVAKGPASDASTLVRLDVVDLALYVALTKHPELLRTLNWRAFESLLADVLETFGFEIELQSGTKDGGVDIFAIKRDQMGVHRYLLQAKRWSNRVGIEPVRQLLFLHVHHRATKSCLATTATFTQGAWELARQYRWQLELRDFEGIRDWVLKAARIKFQDT